MTSHGDAIEKMSAFASRADSFVNAALDQLDDAVEQAFVGETSADVEAVQKASLTPQQHSLLRAAAAFWSDLALDAKREDWRDAAPRVASARGGAEATKRALAECAKKARSEPSEASRDALTRALTAELAAVTKRAEFAETAFMSMLNDVDEAPDPAAPLALAQDTADVVVAAARARQELETLRATRDAAAAAADELEALRGSLEARVEEAASARARDAEGRAAAAEVRADAAMRAREAAEADLAKAILSRDAAESRAFELESSRDSAAALVDLETADAETGEARALEEIRRLRRELEAERAKASSRRRSRGVESSLGGAEDEDGDGDERDALAADAAETGSGSLASLRERLAVRERVAEQLKMALEEAETAREAEREAAAERLEAMAKAHADAMATARREAEENAKAESQREKARAAALEARVATLRALVDAEDAETAETAAAREESAGHERGDASLSPGPSSRDEGDVERGAEGGSAPLAAARARNKRLAGEAAAARRDAAEATARAEDAERRAAAAESAAASRDLAVAELERHLVATTNERTPKGLGVNAAETNVSRSGEGDADADAAASASLLPMVAAQRDRHKRRASELELRVAELEASLATATEERERSRADAAALYDKVRHVQDYYHASSKTGALGAGPGGARIVRVDEAGVALDREDGPLAALAARRAARYGCFPGGALVGGAGGSGSTPPVPLEQLPGGDPGGVLARFALMKSAASPSPGPNAFPFAGLSLGGKTRAAKLTRLFFIAYLAAIHVFLVRAATSRGSLTTPSRA